MLGKEKFRHGHADFRHGHADITELKDVKNKHAGM